MIVSNKQRNKPKEVEEEELKLPEIMKHIPSSSSEISPWNTPSLMSTLKDKDKDKDNTQYSPMHRLNRISINPIVNNDNNTMQQIKRQFSLSYIRVSLYSENKNGNIDNNNNSINNDDEQKKFVIVSTDKNKCSKKILWRKKSSKIAAEVGNNYTNVMEINKIREKAKEMIGMAKNKRTTTYVVKKQPINHRLIVNNQQNQKKKKEGKMGCTSSKSGLKQKSLSVKVISLNVPCWCSNSSDSNNKNLQEILF